MSERVNAIAEAIASANAIIQADEDPLVRSAIGGIAAQLEDLIYEAKSAASRDLSDDRRKGFTDVIAVCRERISGLADPAARQAVMTLMLRLNEKLAPPTRILRP